MPQKNQSSDSPTPKTYKMNILRSARAGVSRSTTSQLRNTTILCVRKGDKVVIMGDGQVTQGKQAIAKGSAKKLRRVGNNVIVGFAGSTADAMTLMEKLEAKIGEFPGQLLRACVELAKEWRGDKSMRQLSASMIVANAQESLEIDGTGNVIAPEEDGVLSVGSGGLYAKSAARALIDIDGLDAEEICKKSMSIAASIDIFTNDQFAIESLDKNELAAEAQKEKEEKAKTDETLKIEPKVEEKTENAKPASSA